MANPISGTGIPPVRTSFVPRSCPRRHTEVGFGNRNIYFLNRAGNSRRFDAVIPNEKNATAAPQRLKIELDRDGFAAEQKIVTDKSLNKIAFTMENRTSDEHATGLWLSLPAGSSYSVLQNGNKVALTRTGNWDYPLRANLKITRQPAAIEIIREAQK